MRNLLLLLTIVVAVLAVGAQPSFAQEGGAGGGSLGAGWSGPGFYLSVLKFLACWLLFLLLGGPNLLLFHLGKSRLFCAQLCT